MIDSEINTPNLDNLRKRFREYGSKTVKSPYCFDQIEIMQYKNRKNPHSGKKVRITEVINDIHNKAERLTVKKKEDLQVAYFSVGQFYGRRKDKNVTEHTGLFVIDIDKKDNPETDFNDLKRKFQNDIYTYACFTSPSGGLKVVVNTNISVIGHHNVYYDAIKRRVLYFYPEITKYMTKIYNIG